MTMENEDLSPSMNEHIIILNDLVKAQNKIKTFEESNTNLCRKYSQILDPLQVSIRLKPKKRLVLTDFSSQGSGDFGNASTTKYKTEILQLSTPESALRMVYHNIDNFKADSVADFGLDQRDEEVTEFLKLAKKPSLYDLKEHSVRKKLHLEGKPKKDSIITSATHLNNDTVKNSTTIEGTFTNITKRLDKITKFSTSRKFDPKYNQSLNELEYLKISNGDAIKGIAKRHVDLQNQLESFKIQMNKDMEYHLKEANKDTPEIIALQQNFKRLEGEVAVLKLELEKSKQTKSGFDGDS